MEEGFEVEEIDPWIEGNDTWRVAKLRFQLASTTHCRF